MKSIELRSKLSNINSEYRISSLDKTVLQLISQIEASILQSTSL